MQIVKIYNPSYLNTDSDYLKLKSNESPYIKDYTIETNQNGELASNTGNLSNSGGNKGVGTPKIGNVLISGIPSAPDGINTTIGGGYFLETNEAYVMFHNSEGNHGIYVIDAETMVASKVIYDSVLNFSLDPKYEIPAHRMSLRVVYDEQNGDLIHIVEKSLIFTSGNNWQNWINIVAAIKTDGLNEASFPYWKTRIPHFDRNEYVEYATRPPMYCPTVSSVPYSTSDSGKINVMINKSVQFCYNFIYTDGRSTTFSPWSLPYSLSASSCNPNNSNMPRCIDISLYVGSPMVEKIQILQKFCGQTDWMLYDTIYRFDNCGTNDPSIIMDEYWKRTAQWSKYSYDQVSNTIKYRWCGDRECQIFSQEDATRLQNDMPIKSVGITSAGDAMLLANNLYRYNNLSCKVTDGIQLSTIADTASAGCKVETVKISIYSYMGSDNDFKSQFAYKHGDVTDDKLETFFGGWYWTYSRSIATVNQNLDLQQDTVDNFGMSFKTNSGFIMYLAGTPYYAVGQQYQVAKDGTMTLYGLINADDKEQIAFVRSFTAAGGMFIMRYDFVVPKGRYIARMAAHGALPTDSYSQTSTWVMGISDSRMRTNGGSILDFYYSKKTVSKEVEIDATAGNVDLWGTGADTFFVFCPYRFDDGAGGIIYNTRWRFNDGYVFEDSSINKIGVELLQYSNSNGRGQYMKDGGFTDHNGFFFAYSAEGEARYAEVNFSGTLNCVTSNNLLFVTKYGSQSGGFLGWGADSIYAKYNVYVKDNNNGIFGDCNRVLVNGAITDCVSGEGIAGVAVTITRGTTAYTGSDGSFQLVVHNSYEGIRKDRIYANAGGECLFYTCDCSAPVTYDYNDATAPCFKCEIRTYPSQLNIQFKLVVSRSKALKSGGRNAIGVVGWDLAGRGTFVNLVGYVDIPSFLETGDFSPRKIAWNIPSGLGLPSSTRWISFFRSGNLNYKSYIQWVGDKIEFLDTKGDAVDTTGGLIRIRITVQSLLDFNTENNFATTATYQFQAGDILRVYDDGDGNDFDPSVTNGFLDFEILGTNYNQTVATQINVQAGSSNIVFNPTTSESDAKTIIIGYDKRLEPLRKKCGFWIEVIRPRDVSETEPFCEMGGAFPVKNGELMNNVSSGVFDTWDTYYQDRYIRITDCSGKTFNHPFESASVTDFWGNGCTSCGRVSIRNSQAVQRWYPDDVIKSDEFVNEGNVNGYGTFREKNRKQFKGQNNGGIVCIHANGSVILFICLNNWFLAGYDMNYLRTDGNGLVVGATLDSKLNDPYQKIDDNYGCEYEHTSSIVIFNGLCFFVDLKSRAILQTNFNSIVKISSIDNESYFDAKLTAIKNYNNNLPSRDYLSNMFTIVCGVDPMHEEYYVTFRKRNYGASNDSYFINSERDISLLKSETIIFSSKGQKWVRFSAIIPEYYSMLTDSTNGKLLLAFRSASAYGHNYLYNAVYNNFFGVSVPSVVVVVAGQPEDTIKTIQSLSIKCNNGIWFVDKIVTNEKNSFSYVPVKYFIKKENMLFAKVLRDMNSYPDVSDVLNGRSMLFDGKRIFGSFARIRFVLFDGSFGKYFEVSEFTVRTIESPINNK